MPTIQEYLEMNPGGQKRLGMANRAESPTPGQRCEVISLSGGRSVTIGWPEDLTFDEWSREVTEAFDLARNRMRHAAHDNEQHQKAKDSLDAPDV